MLFAFVIARVENLAFFAPKSTKGMRASAECFCEERCRVNGQCPVTRTEQQWAKCPLWGFVAADVPTTIYGSPFGERGMV